MTERLNLPLWTGKAPMAKGDDAEDKPYLKLFMPESYDGSKPRGMVVVLPGGGYHARARHEADPIALWLNSCGIPAVVVEYRVAPYRYPVPAEDARRAIRLVRAHASEWHIDPSHVAILGFSAGGHCAGTAATIHEAQFIDPNDPVDAFSSRPDAFISCYSVLTFSEKRHNGSMVQLLSDENGNVDPKMQEYLSLENRVTDKTPPTFLWTTCEDTSVPLENSMYFAAALREHGVPFELHIFPEGYHGLGLADKYPQVAQWKALCITWLEHLGF